MKYLLDTCFISELIKKEPNKGVIDWLRDKDESTLYLSTLTLGELNKGIFKLPKSKKKDDLYNWFLELESRFSERLITIDSKVAKCWGNTQAILELRGKSMPSIDALIACSALEYNLIVVTRNGKDMKRSNVEIIDPWT
jgi:predicted nucleic acid-binding protein